MTPLETAALAALGVAAFAFWMWQSYKLHVVLSNPEHPHHDMATEAIADQHTDPFRWHR